MTIWRIGEQDLLVHQTQEHTAHKATKKTTKSVIGPLSGLSSSNAISHATIGFLPLWPAGNLGDKHQTDDIFDAIKLKTQKETGATVARVLENNTGLSSGYKRIAELAERHHICSEKLNTGEFDHLVVTAAGSGFDMVQALHDWSDERQVTTMFSGHQCSSDILDAKSLPHIIALPSGSMTEAQRALLADKTILLEVAGVGSPLTREKIAANVANYKTKNYPPVPAVDANTIAIILGGDAPDENGVIREFTNDAARQLAHRIKTFLGSRTASQFFVANGPRTGKQAAQKQDKTWRVHCGERKDSATGIPAMDPVTTHHVSELNSFKQAPVYLYDFQSTTLPSAYHSIIDEFFKADDKAGILLIPAESTSMVSETTLLAQHRVIYITESTNATHMRVVYEELGRTGGAILENDGTLTHIARKIGDKTKSAAESIAEVVVARLQAIISGLSPK